MAEVKQSSDPLAARELEWAINSESLLDQHKKENGPIVRTRFPPEPNGYLHIGHAKSMNMNFSLAFGKLGVAPENRRTVFRYDDTNPDAESKEYIDSLRRDLEWLGWKPEKTTYSSDNFQALHDFAVILIRKGLAYVCDMTKAEMEIQRELALKRTALRNAGQDPDVEAPIPSPDILPGRNRNTPVERNLDLFSRMKMGLFEEGSWTPDSRWILNRQTLTCTIWWLIASSTLVTLTLAMDGASTLHTTSRMAPKVYEMSRLNIQYTVLSKRRLLKLVNNKYVRGWNDPRMPTISGLRRRGYTKDIINSFCNDVGATKAHNVVEMEKLFQTARLILASSRRCMAALDPIEVEITNFEEESQKADTFTLSDFRLQDSPQYYGLAPNKAVGIKFHGGNLVCDEVTQNAEGKVTHLKCHLDSSEDRIKPKTYISWVPQDGIHCEVRVYGNLFTVPEPTDLWEDELNPESEVVYANAVVDASVRDYVDAKDVDPWSSTISFQFERMGYFCVDLDTTYDSKTNEGLLVFNRTVSLKEEVFKKALTPEEEAAVEARKAKGKKDVEEKEARMKIDPINLFREAAEFKGKYSKYDEATGIPTHLADGTELTKSAMKKLDKDKQKHIKAQMRWKKE
ncbi:aminoacyl-tRNA synthetase [Fragilaria crotonensis]|nr:aminoacyl-tRNA synthetase [Fragilaria crotonensis]